MAPAAGDKITDNIRLERLLGRGGMGSVWVARHAGLDLDVAVKFVAAEVMAKDDASAIARFRREARLAARIDSPNVVRTLDHGVTSDGVPYIVMELLQGESLAERLSRRGRLAPSDVATIVTQIAAGLEHAHALGVVHRDVKPHNVFVARNPAGGETAKLLDFGIAKSTTISAPADGATSTGALVGTPQYMSPEQLMRSGSHGPSIDVWALAVVAYEAIVGRLPFSGETLAATIVAITRAEMPVPSSVDAALPVALDTFFAKALAVDPDRRFASARALAESLSLASEGAASPISIAARPAAAASDGAAATAEFISAQGLEVNSDADTTEAAPEPLAPTQIAVQKPVGAGSPRGAIVEIATPVGSAPASAGSPIGWVAVAGIGAAALVATFAIVAREPAPPPPAPGRIATAPERSAPSGSVGTAPSAVSAVPAATSAPRAAAAITRTEVQAGPAPGHAAWLPAFGFARDPGDAGLAFLAAQGQCELRSMSLCTDSQWSKACGEHPALGDFESWTASATQTGLVVRGGGGCSSRSTARPSDVAGDRTSACCTRAVAIASDQKNAAFLSTTSKKLLDYETATNGGDEQRLTAILADQVDLFGQPTPKGRAVELAVKSARARVATLHDACDVRTETRNGDPGWVADCNVVSTSAAEIFLSRRRYVRGGPSGLLIEVRDVTRPIGFLTAK